MMLLLLWQFKAPECQVLGTNTQFDLSTAVARRTYFCNQAIEACPA